MKYLYSSLQKLYKGNGQIKAFGPTISGIMWVFKATINNHFSNACPPTPSQKSLHQKFVLIPLVVPGVGNSVLFFQHWPQSLPSFNLSLIWFNIRVIMKKSRKMWNYLVIYHLQKKPQRYSYTFVVSTSLFIIHTCNSQYYRHFPQSWRNQGTFPQMQMQDQMHAKWKFLSTAMHGILEGSNIMHTYI